MKTNVKDTSLDAYNDLKKDFQLGKMQQTILNTMENGTPYTRKELSRLTGIEISSIAGRVNELVDYGCIYVIGKKKCSISLRTVESLLKTERAS